MSLDKLIHELSKLPTIGEKTALRMALHILRQPAEYGQSLARAFCETIGTVRFCAQCHHITHAVLCDICRNERRDQNRICIVEDVADLLALEKTQAFKGLYHVLHGALSPIDGIGPDDIKIDSLIERLRTNTEISEVILATNPNVNGDATALYISRLLKPLSISITRLASGIPIGGHIEYIDPNTLCRAFERRATF